MRIQLNETDFEFSFNFSFGFEEVGWVVSLGRLFTRRQLGLSIAIGLSGFAAYVAMAKGDQKADQLFKSSIKVYIVYAVIFSKKNIYPKKQVQHQIVIQDDTSLKKTSLNLCVFCDCFAFMVLQVLAGKAGGSQIDTAQLMPHLRSTVARALLCRCIDLEQLRRCHNFTV